MTYEQWLANYSAFPDGLVAWFIVGIALVAAVACGALVWGALRRGGAIRRYFVVASTAFLALITALGLLLAFTQTMMRAPLIEAYPEYAARRLDDEISRQTETGVSSQPTATSSDAAVQACADFYRFNPNAPNPDEWERTHDIAAGRKRAARRFDGSPILHEGQQVYNVVIPDAGETVRFNEYGMSSEGSTCSLYQDPDTGAWMSSWGD